MKIIKITITTLWLILVWLIGQDIGHYLFDKPTCESTHNNKPDVYRCYHGELK